MIATTTTQSIPAATISRARSVLNKFYATAADQSNPAAARAVLVAELGEDAVTDQMVEVAREALHSLYAEGINDRKSAASVILNSVL